MRPCKKRRMLQIHLLCNLIVCTVDQHRYAKTVYRPDVRDRRANTLCKAGEHTRSAEENNHGFEVTKEANGTHE